MKFIVPIIFLSSFIFLGCGSQFFILSETDCQKPNTQVANGEVASPKELALDAFCAALVSKRSAPHGFVTIFGSARAKEGMSSYDATREFARLWTKSYGAKHPILTGGGPGIMEAGNLGAKEADGVSLGFSTYFGEGNEPLNSYTTDGYVFASFSQREAEMVDRAAAIVVAPGGVGTEWEIYETIAKIQTHKKAKVPVVLLGGKKVWGSLLARLEKMVAMKTVSPKDPKLLQLVDTPQEAVDRIAKQLKL